MTLPTSIRLCDPHVSFRSPRKCSTWASAVSGALFSTSDSLTTRALQVGDYGVDGRAQLGLASDDAGDLGVQRGDVSGLTGVLSIDVGRDGDEVVAFRDLAVRDSLREVVDVFAGSDDVKDLLPIDLRELVLVASAHELC